MMTSSIGNIFSVSALWEGNPPVTGKFPSQRPVTRSLMFSLICTWTNGWANNRDVGDLRRHRAHYDVTVMYSAAQGLICQTCLLLAPRKSDEMFSALFRHLRRNDKSSSSSHMFNMMSLYNVISHPAIPLLISSNLVSTQNALTCLDIINKGGWNPVTHLPLFLRSPNWQ